MEHVTSKFHFLASLFVVISDFADFTLVESVLAVSSYIFCFTYQIKYNEKFRFY